MRSLPLENHSTNQFKIMETNALRVAVPTATIIVARLHQHTTVAMLRSKKHGGKLVFPGGRLRIGEEDFLGCIIREALEELNLDVSGLKLQTFALSSKPRRDVRMMGLAKYNEGHPVPAFFADAEAEAFFCCDQSFFIHVPDDTQLKGGEEGAPEWIDLTTLQPEDFGIDHATLAAAWIRWIKEAHRPKLGEL